ncbi:MAG TPA: hemerythrin domain-containing protein [Rhodocyclaceae bacterium]|jgi:hemerythrin-like metal-binding protein
MEAFVWDQRFVTGLSLVDEQHQQLVKIVNEVGDLLLSSSNDEVILQAVFKKLAEYARNHFVDEETLMQEVGVDARHRDAHQSHHLKFVEQVVSMWKSRSSMSHPAEILHGFLTAWLSFHILGEDQVMARQIARIRAGASAAEAYDAETDHHDNSTATLLSALQHLYQVLSLQNRDLTHSNEQLEEKVEERTHALAEANAHLQTEREELKRMLVKVEQAQGQLLQSEKMASIGQLAAGVAHEINNPVGFVTSNLGTLSTYVDRLLTLLDAMEKGTVTEQMRKDADLTFLRADIGDLLRESQDGLDRVRKIVASLKDFSHVDESQWQEVDLNKGIESTLSVVWNELKYKADVQRELGQIPLVRCMPAQINQVLMNLLVNAAQSIEERGHIIIRSGSAKDWVWIEVEDSGKGMTPEVQQHIYEPFFTTKPVGKGTGLGLSVSYDIVKKHGGRFDLKSALGQGSTFRIWLPVAGLPQNDSATGVMP